MRRWVQQDGPLPAHYEPMESPVPNSLYPKMRENPTIERYVGPLNEFNPNNGESPIVATN